MDLKKLTIKEILESYDLPHKFLVKFALFCANYAKHLLNDKRSLKALEVVELWLEDKATINEVKYAANANAKNAIGYAAYAVNGVMYTVIYATNAANYVSYTITYANIDADTYKPKLISMINELTPLEQELYRR